MNRTAPRIALVCDFLEEKWPSMDLVADMLRDRLVGEYGAEFRVEMIRPPFVRRFSRLPAIGHRRAAYNADRVLNRFFDYPRVIRRRRDSFDLFHIVDHTYAHLVHHLPSARTVVTCHDLDAFRPVLEPRRAPASRLMAVMARRILSGMRKAAMVTCESHATMNEILAHRLVSPERLIFATIGIHPAFSPCADAAADAEAMRLLGPADAGAPELLHVGLPVARKRIDILLRVFAAVRDDFPRARMVRVGGAFTSAQTMLAAALGVSDAIVVLPFVSSATLAAVYRRAAAVAMPSEAEGFGLPVVEAMACGTPVIASDLAVLHEVGGDAADYAAVGDVAAFAAAVIRSFRQRAELSRFDQRRGAGLAQAAKFSWSENARGIAAVYRRLLATAA
ncbi:MAG: glycosyltransferase [Candidatus Binataceae bacterium]